MTQSNTVFLGLGSNIGDKLNFLKKAVEQINQLENTTVTEISSIYKTPPFGYENQDYFLNCAIKIETDLNHKNLLHLLQNIEIKLGRKRLIKWGPRTIDIDILFFNDEIINEPNLKIPHPYIQERAFVLIPLNDIANDFIHPVLQQDINSLLKNLSIKDIEGIEKIYDKL